MFGPGGCFVEALQDVIFRMTPIDNAQALEMIKGILGARVLGGMRGCYSARETDPLILPLRTDT